MLHTFFKFVFILFHLYGYPILFVTSFVESLPLIGTIIPGATVAVLGGFVARKHILHFSAVLFLVTIGAYLGDVLSYFIGRHYGYNFLKKFGKYIFLTEARLEYVRSHIKNHRGKTLILGRFTSFTRSIAPFAAGASHVDILPFLWYTFLSAFLWALSHILIGFIFGKWLERLSKYLGLIFFVAILIGVALVYAYRFINRRHHVFKRFHVYTLTTMLFSLFFFSSTLQGVLDNDWLFLLNRYIARFVFSIQTPWLTEVMIWITSVGDVFYISFLTLALTLYLVFRKKYYMASLTLFTMVLGGVLQFILKKIVNLPRPIHPLVHTMFSTFPSGHSTAAVIFGSFIFLSFLDSFKSRIGKYFLFVFTLIGVVLVGISRIYLNAHWTTDVIAGMALGLFCVTISILFFRVILFAKKWLL